MKAVRKINEIGRNPNNVFRLVKKMKIESTDVVGGRCMRGNDGSLYHNEMDHFIIMRRIEQNSGKHICQK